MWQTMVEVGRLGRRVYLMPHKWKWVAKMRADFYCIAEVRETVIYTYKLKPGEKYKLGIYLQHPDGYLESL